MPYLVASVTCRGPRQHSKKEIGSGSAQHTKADFQPSIECACLLKQARHNSSTKMPCKFKSSLHMQEQQNSRYGQEHVCITAWQTIYETPLWQPKWSSPT